MQNLIGVLPEFNQARQTMSQDQANAASVKVELQADCFAGAWAKGEFEQGFLENGDVDEAMNAANQIGDDRLTGGRVPSTPVHAWHVGAAHAVVPAEATNAAIRPVRTSSP